GAPVDAAPRRVLACRAAHEAREGAARDRQPERGHQPEPQGGEGNGRAGITARALDDDRSLAPWSGREQGLTALLGGWLTVHGRGDGPEQCVTWGPLAHGAHGSKRAASSR